MNEPKTVYVWDILVRLFHWSLVVLFFAGYLTGEDGEDLHAAIGYAVLGLIVFRVVWGFVGSKYARFSDFIYPPSQVIAYLNSLLQRRPRHYLGHNPAGGWVVIALLLIIFISCWTGLVAYGKEGHGPLAQTDLSLVATVHANGDEHEDDEGEGERGKSKEEEFWEEVHEVFSNLALLLVVLHIVGVVVSSHLHHENLVRAMITGRKQLPDDSKRTLDEA